MGNEKLQKRICEGIVDMKSLFGIEFDNITGYQIKIDSDREKVILSVYEGPKIAQVNISNPPQYGLNNLEELLKSVKKEFYAIFPEVK